MEIPLLALHVALLVASEFLEVPSIHRLYDIGVVMGALPMIGIVAGRWWPSWLLLPVTLLPIAGKTLRQLVYAEQAIPVLTGWVCFVILPLTLAIVLAVRLSGLINQPAAGGARPDKPSVRSITAGLLLATTPLYFLLNFAFFRFPWPWQPWTARTPNAVVFTACTAAIVAAAMIAWREGRPGIALSESRGNLAR